jgi:hypothetical protein
MFTARTTRTHKRTAWPNADIVISEQCFKEIRRTAALSFPPSTGITSGRNFRTNFGSRYRVWLKPAAWRCELRALLAYYIRRDETQGPVIRSTHVARGTQ